ncbi:hypothetical protein J7E64_21710 [Priestia megaterium]|nr:hypothetical protein [Priestia megaterium]
MIGGQSEDSCGLIGRPRKAKSCMEINCGVTSGSAHISHISCLFVLRMDSCRYFSTSSFFSERIVF